MRSSLHTSLLVVSLAALALAVPLGLAAPALADVVDACPPGFQPSHGGCHFGPTAQDLYLCGGCVCVLAGLGVVSALLLLRRSRASGPREGDHG